MTATQKNALKKIVDARHFRNPVVGRAHERFYLIDAATMRVIRKLAAS